MDDMLFNFPCIHSVYSCLIAAPIACVYCYSIQVPVTLAMHVMVFQYLLFVWTVLCTLHNNIYDCSRSFWYIPLPLAVILVHVCVISFYIMHVHVHMYMYMGDCTCSIMHSHTVST